MLVVVLFGFLNIKSVKIYAIPYIVSATLLLYKLDTLLLKQKNLPVLDITGFYFRIRTQVMAFVLRTSAFTSCGKTPHYIQYGRFFCFNSTVSYTCDKNVYNNYRSINWTVVKTHGYYLSRWVSDWCLTPIQFFSYTMFITIYFSMRGRWDPLCTRPTRLVAPLEHIILIPSQRVFALSL